MEYIGIWEKVNNPHFNYGEFATIRNNAGLNNFKISVREFVERTGAICLQAKAGRYGANYSEACDAESKADFIHKLTIAQKEAHETIYWLKVLFGSKLISKAKYEELMADVDELHKMLSSSIKTLKSEEK